MRRNTRDILEGDATNFFVKFISCIVVGAITILLINNYGFKNGKMICDNYIINSYLYVVLGFVIMGISVLINNKFDLIRKLGMIGFIVSFILSIILILIFHRINNNDLFNLHLIWSLFFLVLGYSLTITLIVYNNSNILYTGIMMTILVTIFTGLIGYYYGEYIPENIDNYLFIALILLILVRIFGPSFVNDVNKFYYLMAFVGLIIFILLLLSYHKKMRNNSLKCKTDSKLPNYPNEAMGLIIKIRNVLQDILRILDGNRKK